MTQSRHSRAFMVRVRMHRYCIDIPWILHGGRQFNLSDYNQYNALNSIAIVQTVLTNVTNHQNSEERTGHLIFKGIQTTTLFF